MKFSILNYWAIFIFTLCSCETNNNTNVNLNPEKPNEPNKTSQTEVKHINNSTLQYLKKVDSIFDTHIFEKDHITKCEILPLDSSKIIVFKNTEKPDKYGFYDGPYKIRLDYENQSYNGFSNENTIDFDDTRLILINDSLQYLFVRWKNTPDLCEYSYSSFYFEGFLLKKISSSAFGCDL